MVDRHFLGSRARGDPGIVGRALGRRGGIGPGPGLFGCVGRDLTRLGRTGALVGPGGFGRGLRLAGGLLRVAARPGPAGLAAGDAAPGPRSRPRRGYRDLRARPRPGSSVAARCLSAGLAADCISSPWSVAAAASTAHASVVPVSGRIRACRNRQLTVGNAPDADHDLGRGRERP